MVESRGDFKIYHEPSLLPYHRLLELTFSHDWFCEETPSSFDEVKDQFFSESGNVFVKEMGFHLEPFVDDDLVLKPNIHFVFLLRDPHSSIVSLYQRIETIVSDFHEAVGYRAAFAIYEKIVRAGGKRPLILLSEELMADPERVVRQFCDYVGVPFIESSLSWSDLGESFDGHEEWHEGKRGDLVQHWHGAAIRSTHFTPLRTYAVDENGEPTFTEVANTSDRQECQKAYRESLPYYLYLRHHR